LILFCLAGLDSAIGLAEEGLDGHADKEPALGDTRDEGDVLVELAGVCAPKGKKNFIIIIYL